MSTYLVTGGAGFIGSNIVLELIKQGHRVKVIDNFVAGKKQNLEDVLDKIELIEGDIRNLDLLREITEGCDYVLHQAALRSVPKSLNDPLSYDEVNAKGTLNVLIVSREAKVKRVVYASSSSVYGDSPHLPQREDQIPQPISPYAATKLAGEHYCRVFNKVYDLETVCLRYFNVFGPRQSLESEYAVVIPKFITCLLRGEQPPIHGDGNQTRDFTYIENVVEANLGAATCDKVAGEVFNIACGKNYSVLELLKYLNEILGKDVKPHFTAPRPGDARHTKADITKMKKLLRLSPKVDFVEGLEKTTRWFREQERLE